MSARTPNTPSRALALSSSRTPRQQLLMSATSGRSMVDAHARLATGLNGRRVYRPDSARSSVSGSVPNSARLGGVEGAAGVPSSLRREIDVQGSGGRPRGLKKVDESVNRAAAAHGGSGHLPDRVGDRSKKFIGRESNISNLGSVDGTVKFAGKRPTKQDKAPSPVLNPHISAAKAGTMDESPLRRAQEIQQQREEFKKMTSPKDRGYTYQPVQRVDNRNQEDRLMSGGGARKTKGHSGPQLSARQAATPPWVQE